MLFDLFWDKPWVLQHLLIFGKSCCVKSTVHSVRDDMKRQVLIKELPIAFWIWVWDFLLIGNFPVPCSLSARLDFGLEKKVRRPKDEEAKGAKRPSESARNKVNFFLYSKWI